MLMNFLGNQLTTQTWGLEQNTVQQSHLCPGDNCFLQHCLCVIQLVLECYLCLYKSQEGLEGMTQYFKGLPGFAEGPGLVAITHMVTYNHLYTGFRGTCVHTYTHKLKRQRSSRLVGSTVSLASMSMHKTFIDHHLLPQKEVLRGRHLQPRNSKQI